MDSWLNSGNLRMAIVFPCAINVFLGAIRVSLGLTYHILRYTPVLPLIWSQAKMAKCQIATFPNFGPNPTKQLKQAVCGQCPCRCLCRCIETTFFSWDEASGISRDCRAMACCQLPKETLIAGRLKITNCHKTPSSTTFANSIVKFTILSTTNSWCHPGIECAD